MNNAISLRISFDTDKFFSALVLVAAIFLILDTVQFLLTGMVSEELLSLIDITNEGNIPTLYSSLLAIAVGVVAYLASATYKDKRLLKRLSWFGISLFFIYVGIDDATHFHERLATLVSNNLKDSDDISALSRSFLSFKSYYWQALLLPLFSVIAIFMLVFLKNELKDGKAYRYFIYGITCYVFAVALDYIDGIPAYYTYITNNSALALSEIRHISRAIEEFIEIVGTSFICVAFMRFFSSDNATDINKP